MVNSYVQRWEASKNTTGCDFLGNWARQQSFTCTTTIVKIVWEILHTRVRGKNVKREETKKSHDVSLIYKQGQSFAFQSPGPNEYTYYKEKQLKNTKWHQKTNWKINICEAKHKGIMVKSYIQRWETSRNTTRCNFWGNWAHQKSFIWTATTIKIIWENIQQEFFLTCFARI